MSSTTMRIAVENAKKQTIANVLKTIDEITLELLFTDIKEAKINGKKIAESDGLMELLQLFWKEHLNPILKSKIQDLQSESEYPRKTLACHHCEELVGDNEKHECAVKKIQTLQGNKIPASSQEDGKERSLDMCESLGNKRPVETNQNTTEESEEEVLKSLLDKLVITQKIWLDKNESYLSTIDSGISLCKRRLKSIQKNNTDRDTGSNPVETRDVS